MKLIVVNGFLGSGKTTFLQEIIPQYKTKQIAVVVNEYGEASIDALEYKELNVIVDEINSGSIFCSCKSGQFLDVLLTLSNLQIDYVFVESSGLSDPYSLGKILTLYNDLAPEKLEELTIITIVDGTTLHKVIHTLDLVKRQIEISDIIIINKLDLMNEKDLRRCKQIISIINPFARNVETTYSKVKIDELNFHRIDQIQLPRTVHLKNLLLEAYTVLLEENPLIKIEQLLKELNDRVYRIKGFVNGTHIVNTTFNEKVYITPRPNTSQNYLVFLFNKQIITKNEIISLMTELNIKNKGT